jgi:DNA-binding transcriptional LysR family regulator
MITAAVEGIGVALVPSYSVLSELERMLLVQLFPDIQIPEDRFRIYQKNARAPLEKHRALVAYLQSINPVEFGSDTRQVQRRRTRRTRQVGTEDFEGR